MKVGLLELDSGAVSLEFDEADIGELRMVIQDRFGEIRNVETGPLNTVIEFGGERFIYYHERDPCLISQSTVGATMLRDLATAVSGS